MKKGAKWAIFGTLAGLSIVPQLARENKKYQSKKSLRAWRSRGMADRLVLKKEGEGHWSGVYYSIVDDLPLSIEIFEAKEPKGIVKIVHGAQEHKAYYKGFAQFLRESGYTVLLSDNRGHGLSVNNQNPRGYISSIDDIVIDEFTLAVMMKRRYPYLPFAMFGHSFGSLIARNFMMEHDDVIDKLILTGVVCYPPSAHIGVFLGNIESYYTDEKKRGLFIRIMDAKTKAALNTISNNPEFLDSFQKDGLLVEHYLNGGAMAIWESAARLKDWRRYQVKNKNLSVLVLNGSEDPLTGGALGLADTAGTFYKLGYTDYENHVYPYMKHDLLHEEASLYIMREIVDFLER